MFFLRLTLALFLTAVAAQAGNVIDGSTRDAGGGRVLHQSIVVSASAAKVWAAMVDPAQVKRWLVPFAAIDLRQGGSIEQGFDKNSKPGDANNIRAEIISYMPERFAVLRNTNAPLNLVGRDLFKNVVQVVELEPLADGKTRLTLTHTGYGTGPQWDALYDFFSTHNPEYLEGIKAALETGALRDGGGA